MERLFRAGDPVRTPLGKGVVREAMNNGRLLIEIGGRAVVLEPHTVTAVDADKRPARKRKSSSPPPEDRGLASGGAARELDLHGLTVEEALARVEQALNDALLEDAPELRLIHGKGSGRIRAALHHRLRGIPVVRSFRLDPRNAGVTIVSL